MAERTLACNSGSPYPPSEMAMIINTVQTHGNKKVIPQVTPLSTIASQEQSYQLCQNQVKN